MKELVTPKQVAQAIGVSESSLKRWCDRGLLKTIRTPGGHRRLGSADVIQFLRESGQQLVRPELLGLPSSTGQGTLATTRARDRLRDALLAGDNDQCRRIIFDLHLAGQAICHICDDVLADAMQEIGVLWGCGDAEVYQERRACNICMRILDELRSAIPAGTDDDPQAIGGTPECDPYMLPTSMAEIVLRQEGWRSQSLGSRLPFATLIAAIRDVRPQIFWLSVSHVNDEQGFVTEYRTFYEQIGSDVAVVVGGRALTEPLRRQMEYTAHCDNMQHLESFARTLKRSLSHDAKTNESAAPSIAATRDTRKKSAQKKEAK